jgi:diguanylate cyclase (GGDEF)-like protein
VGQVKNPLGAVRRAWDRRPFGLTVGARFGVTVGVLVAAVISVALIGVSGVARIHTQTTSLELRLGAVQDAADLVSAVSAIHHAALLQVAVDSPELNAATEVSLNMTLLPAFDDAVKTMRTHYAGRPDDLALVDVVRDGMQPYRRLREEQLAWSSKRRAPLTISERANLAAQIDQIMGPMVDASEALRALEAARADDAGREADRSVITTVRTLGIGLALALLLGGLGLWALISGLLPRIRAYSRFATDIAAGQPTAKLNPRGRDELTYLGRALDDMVESERAQTEFIEFLQVAANEDEAQQLVQRHLERTLPGSRVVVMRRSTTANRLVAATSVSDPELLERIACGDSHSCAALRLGRSHRHDPESPTLMTCGICTDSLLPSSCEPLLVSGEVIGSVLSVRPQGHTPADEATLRRVVSQAAPTLANLRNLALAEFRAGFDSLTGLPNKQRTDETLKRLVAQADRTKSPLSAIMLDLDHFKQINDRYGHSKGDEVLAAVGATIQHCLRDGDFAGRFGGEEFLLLLPDTDAKEATMVAERVRAAISEIAVADLDREVTASLGIADLPEDPGSAVGMMHEADRALYAAKAAGRNRVAVAPRSPDSRQQLSTKAGAKLTTQH